jgi:hypothetical protein
MGKYYGLVPPDYLPRYTCDTSNRDPLRPPYSTWNHGGDVGWGDGASSSQLGVCILPAVNIRRVMFVSKWGAVLRGSWGWSPKSHHLEGRPNVMWDRTSHRVGTICFAKRGDTSDSSPELCQNTSGGRSVIQ